MASGGGMSGAGWLYAAGAVSDAISLYYQGQMAETQARRAEVYRKFNEWNAEREAGLAIAASQRTALEERRQADLVASRGLAVAAASGGGVSDPTVINTLARTKGEGYYRASVALYEGNAKARALRVAGAGGIDTTGLHAPGYNAAATGRLAYAGASLYAKYGMNGPGTQSDRGASGDSALIQDAGISSSPVG